MKILQYQRFLIALLFFIPFFLTENYAQETNPISCGYDDLQQQLINTDPAYAKKVNDFNQQYREYMIQKANSEEKSASVVYTVPVVVHIIHAGAPLGSTANPTDATVANIVEEASDRFRHMHSGAGTYTNPYYGVDTEIEFCMATTDPNGNYTTGVTRHFDPVNAVNNFNVISLGVDALAWDKSLYCNLFVVTQLNAAGVYVVGTDFTIYDAGSFWSGLIAHEQGHYFSLAHTFSGCINDDCLSNGDLICDTPPKGTPGTAGGSCASPANNCTTDEDDTSLNNPYRAVALGGLGDQPDMLANYLDYTGSCWDSFTEGQKDRMRLNIDNNRVALINNTAACAPQPIPAIDAGISAVALNQANACSASFTPDVTIKNYGNSDLTSVDIVVALNGITVHTESWTGTILPDSELSVTLSNSISICIGSNIISFSTATPNGGTDGNIYNDSDYRSVEYIGGSMCQSFQACTTFNPNSANGPGATTVVNVSATFPAPAASAPGVQICVTADGDIGSSLVERFDVLDEDNNLQGQTNSGSDCAGPSSPFCFTASITDYNNWIVDGTITVTFDPITTFINPTLCAGANEACVSINVPQGSSSFSLTGGGVANVICNNNATSPNSSDDYIQFDLNPVGVGLGASYSVTAMDGSNPVTVSLLGGGAATGIAYNSATSFQLPNGSAGSGNTYTLTITDVDFSYCTFIATINDPGSCSVITFQSCTTFNPNTASGSGNTTIVDVTGAFPSLAPSDPDVEICVTANGDIGHTVERFDVLDEDNNLQGQTNNASDCSGPSAPFCFTPSIADYNNWIVDGTITVTFDPISTAINPVLCAVANEVCVIVNVPLSNLPCSFINGGLNNVLCHNNGTTSNSNDDYIQFDLDPVGNSLGASYSVTAMEGANPVTVSLLGGGAATGVGYNSATSFQLPIGSAGSGNTYIITITDIDDNTCTLDVTVNDPGSCSVVAPPNCTNLTNPLNGAINVGIDEDLSWGAATGFPTGYRLTVGTSSGGTDILNNVDVGNVTTYDIGTQSNSTTIYVTIIPYNGDGDAIACTEESFTTEPVGLCPDLIISNLVINFISGSTVDYNFTIKNVGNTSFTFPSIAPYIVWQSYKSIDDQLDGSDPGAGGAAIFAGSLAPGAQLTFHNVASIDLNIYNYLILVIDNLDALVECDETNNSAIVQILPGSPPNCTNLTAPIHGAIDVGLDDDLSWAFSAGNPTGYKLSVGTSSGGTDILDNIDVGNVTTYDPGTFPSNATIYVTITPYNGDGDATGCLEESFTTICSNSTITWIGGTGDWEDSNNWDLGYVPQYCNDVIIPSGLVTVSSNANIVIKTLHVYQGVEFDIQDGAEFEVTAQ